jgi:hypothetical protein
MDFAWLVVLAPPLSVGFTVTWYVPAAAYVWVGLAPAPVWPSPKFHATEAMLPSTSELRSVKAHWRSVQPKVKSAVGGVLLPPDGPFESLHAASSAAQLTRVKIREERIVLGSMPQGKSTLSLGIATVQRGRPALPGARAVPWGGVVLDDTPLSRNPKARNGVAT